MYVVSPARSSTPTTNISNVGNLICAYYLTTAFLLTLIVTLALASGYVVPWLRNCEGDCNWLVGSAAPLAITMKIGTICFLVSEACVRSSIPLLARARANAFAAIMVAAGAFLDVLSLDHGRLISHPYRISDIAIAAICLSYFVHARRTTFSGMGARLFAARVAGTVEGYGVTLVAFAAVGLAMTIAATMLYVGFGVDFRRLEGLAIELCIVATVGLVLGLVGWIWKKIEHPLTSSGPDVQGPQR